MVSLSAMVTIVAGQLMAVWDGGFGGVHVRSLHDNAATTGGSCRNMSQYMQEIEGMMMLGVDPNS